MLCFLRRTVLQRNAQDSELNFYATNKENTWKSRVDLCTSKYDTYMTLHTLCLFLILKKHLLRGRGGRCLDKMELKLISKDIFNCLFNSVFRAYKSNKCISNVSVGVAVVVSRGPRMA